MSNLGPLAFQWPPNEAGKVVGWGPGRGTYLKNWSAVLAENTLVANPIEPRFGAAGDGVTDDTTAIQAAIAWLVTQGGGTLEINHHHKTTGSITHTDDTVKIVISSPAPGMGSITLESEADIPVLDFSFGAYQGSDSNPPWIFGLGIYRKAAAAGGKGIRCVYTSREDAAKGIGFRVENCEIDNAEGYSGYFHYGIYADTCLLAFFRNNFIRGRAGLTTTKTGAGIFMGNWATGSYADQNRIQGFQYGIDASDQFYAGDAEEFQTEGVKITNNTILNCDTPLRGSTEDGEVAWIVTGNVLNGGRHSAKFRNILGLIVTNNTCQHNSRNVDHCDILLESDDGTEGSYTTRSLSAVIGHNRSLAQTNLRLKVTGITRGASTTVSYTASTDNRTITGILTTGGMVRIQYSGSDVFTTGDEVTVYGITTGPTELNGLYFEAGTVDTAANTVELVGVDPATLSAAWSAGGSIGFPYDTGTIANGDVCVIYGMNGSTKGNHLPFVVSDLNTGAGTFKIKNYYDGTSDIDSSTWGAWASAGNVERYSRHIEVKGGSNIIIDSASVALRHVGVHLWPQTQNIKVSPTFFVQSNRGIPFINDSANKATIEFQSALGYDDGGARGDGVNDDAPNIQAVLTAGRIVRLNPLKTYVLTTRLSITTAGTGIEGNGATLKMSMASGHFDNTVYGNRTAANAVGIYASSVSKPFVRNCVIKPTTWTDARYLKAVYFTGCTDAEITGNDCSDFSRGSGVITITDCPRALVNLNKIHDCRTRSKYESDGTTLITSATMQITGIEVDDGSSTGSKDAKIVDNWIWNLTGSNTILTEATLLNIQTDGINVKGTDGKSSGVLVARNHIKNVGEGIDIFAWDSIVTENYIERAFGAGIKYFHGAQRLQIKHNTIVESGLAAIYTGGTTSSSNNIDRNFVTDNIIRYVDRSIDWYEYDGVTKFYTTSAGSTHWTTTRSTTTAVIRVDYQSAGTGQATNHVFARNFADIGYTGSGDGANAGAYAIFCENGTLTDFTLHEVDDNTFLNWKTGKYADSGNRLWIKPGKPHRIMQTANRAAYTNNTSAQTMFDAATITATARGVSGSFNAKASTAYGFRMRGVFSSLSGSSNSLNFGFGGTATATYVNYELKGRKGEGSAGNRRELTVSSLSAAQATPSDTATTAVIEAAGIIVVNAAGTLIPQITMVTNSAASVLDRGSFFEIWEIDDSTSVSGDFA